MAKKDKVKVDPYERVRVKLPSGAETTLSRAFADRKGYEILDKPITRHGRPLGFKPKTSLRPTRAPEGGTTTTTGDGADNPGGDATTS